MSKKKCRQYDSSYTAYGFVYSETNPLLPQCLVCGVRLTNASMKPAKLSNHLKTRHPDLSDKTTEYFRALRGQTAASSFSFGKVCH